MVQDEIQVKLIGHLLGYQIDEAAELTGAVPGGQVGDHVARGDPERGIELGGP